MFSLLFLEYFIDPLVLSPLVAHFVKDLRRRKETEKTILTHSSFNLGIQKDSSRFTKHQNLTITKMLHVRF